MVAERGRRWATILGQFGRGRARRVAGATAIAVLCGGWLGVQSSGAGQTSRPVRLFAVEAVGGRLEVVRYDVPSLRDADKIAVAAYGRGAISVEVDGRVQSVGDPMESYQWALSPAATSFRSAWSTTKGAGVTVAVVDSGVRRTHQDLAGAVLTGTDLVTGSGDGSNDQNGHGTHVAGIIAARLNGKGIVGAAPAAKILPVRVLDGSGSGYSSDVAEGIIYAADHGAKVINLSLGGSAASQGTRTAIQYAIDRGSVVVAAAGNSGQSGNAPLYPGAFPEPIAVGAVDSSLRRAAFSNYGPYVDIVAPGDSVVSAWGSGDNAYAWASGTSMATPHVAAAAALAFAANPSYSSAKVRQRLETTANDLGPAGRDDQYGFGIVDPKNAGAIALPPGGDEGKGYWVVTSDGRVGAYGGARHYSDLAGFPVGSPTVAAARTPSGKGYWLVTAKGMVFAFGDARSHGGLHTRRLAKPVVAMAASASGAGYLLLTGDGTLYAFGDARSYGSINVPVRDLAMMRSGRGYWLLASDGRAYAFGEARYRSTLRRTTVGAGAVSLTSANGRGFWAVTGDGGVANYGTPSYGSPRAYSSASPGAGTRIRAVGSGRGYYVLTSSGLVYSFGSARNFGSRTTAATAVDLLLT